MKVRNRFVSNSSSSSFIIDYHKDKSEITEEKILLIMDKLVEIEQIFKPDIKKEDIFTLKANPEEMSIGDKNEDIINIRKKWEKDDDKSYRTDFNKVKGKIIVHSVEDNSIPYWMKEFFEDRLDAKYWHWG